MAQSPDEYAAHRDRTLESLAEAKRIGLDCWVEMLPPGPPWPCDEAEAQSGKRYGINDLPKMPLPGCTRAHGCACCFVIQQPQPAPLTPEEMARNEREFRSVYASLDTKTKAFVRNTLAAFGIKFD
jgi:hypothetical protein